MRVVATSRQFGEGTLSQTNNQLDVAIEGNGFLAVQQNEKAFQAFQESTRLDQDAADTCLGMGQVYERLGRPDGSAAAFAGVIVRELCEGGALAQADGMVRDT